LIFFFFKKRKIKILEQRKLESI